MPVKWGGIWDAHTQKKQPNKHLERLNRIAGESFRNGLQRLQIHGWTRGWKGEAMRSRETLLQHPVTGSKTKTAQNIWAS